MKIIPPTILYQISFLILIAACTPVPQQSSDKLIISLEKTPCYGNCPVYQLNIYQDGYASLNVESNLTLNEGQYATKLTQEKLKELNRAFNTSNFFNLKDEYHEENITDAPTTYLYFSSNGKDKKITDYTGAPEELKSLENKVAELIEEVKWKKIKE